MTEKMMKKSRILLVALLGLVAVAALTIWGCGTDGYDNPNDSITTTKTATALIEPQTLKQWMDEGKVNGKGLDRVVIVDVSSAAQYQGGHIPGALLLNSGTELYKTRLEGIAAAFGMVPDGASMDSCIQRMGIDKNTTIVFTTNTANPIIWATRAYFTFRYWGFPKERLKVLNGYNKAWDATYPATITTDVPTVAPSSFSVRNNVALAADLRASLGEMISVVKAGDANNVIIDTRGSDGLPASPKYSYDGDAGTTPGVFLPGSDYVVFEGRMKGARAVGYATLLDSANNNKFLPADQLPAKFTAIGMDSSKTAYVYCRTGVIASSEFFVLEGILGWKVLVYDGSWSQWGSMSGEATKDGVLDSYSGWKTDAAALSEVITYNKDNALTVERIILDPLSVQLYSNTADLTANQIEKEDAAYMAGGAAGGTTTSAPAASGGGGC